MSKRIHFAGPSFFILMFIGVVVACTVLKVTASVLIPLAIALLLSFVLEPLVLLLNTKMKIPQWLCIVLVMFAVMVLIFAVGNLMFSSLRTILLQYPKYEGRFLIIYQTVAEMFDWSYNNDLSLFSNLWEQISIRNFIQNQAKNLSTSLVAFLKDALLVFLFIIFFIAEMRFFREKAEAAFAETLPETIRSIFSEIINQTARYVSVKFYISLGTGLIVFCGTLALGLDFPVIWAFIAFVMNFIPTFGSIFSGILTTLFALVQFWPQQKPVLLTGLLMLGVNQILGNVLEPKLQGKNLGLSPFIIISSLSMWGWLWGFAGLILAVPLMVIVKIVCENIDFLYPVSIMLSSGPPKPQPEETTEPPEKTDSSEEQK